MLAPMLASLVLHVQQKQLWHQMEEALERESLVTIRVPATELHWVRKNKELIWQGRHFDTKQVKWDANGICIITGLFDDEEAALESAFAKATQGESEDLGRSIWQFISIVNTPPIQNSSLQCEPQFATADLDFCTMPVPQLMAAHFEVPTPPPLG